MCIRDRYNGYLIANNAITAISNAQKGLAAVQAYKAAVANTTPVSYTHLDVYKRQLITNMP